MSKLDGYHMMVVSQYFPKFVNFVTLSLVCKKFNKIMDNFHYNPIPLTKNTLNYFPNIETFHVYTKNSEIFGKEFFDKKCVVNNSEVISNTVFFKVVIWYEVDFITFANNKNSNFVFKNITFTKNDTLKFKEQLSQIFCDTCNSFITSLAPKCFENISYISTLHLPLTISSLGARAFSSCKNLKSIEIPTRVKTIGFACFENCEFLTKFSFTHRKYIKNSTEQILVTQFEDHLFEGCTSLKEVEIPDNVTSLGNGCFKNCATLTKIILPSTLNEIKTQCFSMCTSLQIINIQKSVNKLWNNAFEMCLSLKEIEIGCDVNVLPFVVNLNEGLVHICGYCFNGCNNLKRVEIPNSVEIIDENAFPDHCKLKIYFLIYYNNFVNIHCKIFHDKRFLNQIVLIILSFKLKMDNTSENSILFLLLIYIWESILTARNRTKLEKNIISAVPIRTFSPILVLKALKQLIQSILYRIGLLSDWYSIGFGFISNQNLFQSDFINIKPV
ncbi:hypothetical protein EIN_088740 [Entamoeba invadens IP1]|uniref:Leucine rich repeat containing protein BspA family protein n=1 Tax=Entamoeba invadens IP1 TaxID=370355 RepID=A0A0A1U0E9_ENTIV|nr:hypothetical protein EIN_088740 [Entamoeba invadens IP1]ELP84371.1 hypothetical protein EIN_088740 [Entamoeba invadens IP1]|eukprot:XP_004183717.1 hypothetical protein EIN_088740 [Entamoeba invadens IP1]